MYRVTGMTKTGQRTERTFQSQELAVRYLQDNYRVGELTKIDPPKTQATFQNTSFVLIDTENGQAIGPFTTVEEAVAHGVAIMYATGEWTRDHFEPTNSADQQSLMEMGWLVYELAAPLPSSAY